MSCGTTVEILTKYIQKHIKVFQEVLHNSIEMKHYCVLENQKFAHPSLLGVLIQSS